MTIFICVIAGLVLIGAIIGYFFDEDKKGGAVGGGFAVVGCLMTIVLYLGIPALIIAIAIKIALHLHLF